MLLLTLHLSWTEIVILQVGALILGCTIYFFYTSRRALQQTLRTGALKPQQHSALPVGPPMHLAPGPRPEGAAPPARSAARPPEPGLPPIPPVDPRAITLLKENLQEQHHSLSALIQRVEQLEAGGKKAREEKEMLQARILELEAELDERDAELEEARRQEALVAEITSRMDEVYTQFRTLQQKTAALEKQAAEAQELAVELEDMQRSYQVLQREFVRKQEVLDELASENMRLQSQLAQTTDKLSAAGQGQQLAQQHLLLNELKTDLHQVSEGQSKLRNQLRRIAELESMLEQFSVKSK